METTGCSSVPDAAEAPEAPGPPGPACQAQPQHAAHRAMEIHRSNMATAGRKQAANESKV